MSGMAQSNNALEQELEQTLVLNYLGYSVVCLVAYEFVITLDREIAVIWRRKFTATTLLLLSVRWLMLLDPIPGAISGRTSCLPLNTLRELAYVIVVAQTALFSALRVYALWRGSRLRYIFLFITLTLGAVPIGTNTFGWVHTSIAYQNIPPFGSTCATFINVSQKINNDLLYLTRSSAIAVDVVVLVLTWAKSFGLFRQMRRLKLSSSTITTVLLRDGTLYFIALLGVNILQLLTYSDRFSNGSYADGFLQSMPSLLMQRFMLNLRQPDHSTGESELDEGHSSSLSLSFRRSSGFLGNIGEPLDHSQSEYLQDDGDHDVYCATEDSQNRLGESFVQHAGPQCAPHADLIHISQGEPASLVSAAVTPTPAPAESLVFVNQVMQG